MKFCYYDLEKVVETAFTVGLINWYRYPVYWISHNLSCGACRITEKSQVSFALINWSCISSLSSVISIKLAGFEALAATVKYWGRAEGAAG